MPDDQGRPADEPVDQVDAPAAQAAEVTAHPPGEVGVDPAGDLATPPAEAADLLALIDRLSGLLDRTDLTELEVEAGATGLVLRKPAALASTVVATAAAGAPAATIPGEPSTPGRERPERPSVKAPLTGIWYGSPSPGSPPYVQVGGEVAVGQTIGLIEAMKLFNEIKADLAGRVVRMVAENGQLVKAKQPLIEVEPL
jgi:acetyl-CoA carboxylase biotin carboxyl carrier protein